VEAIEASLDISSLEIRDIGPADVPVNECDVSLERVEAQETWSQSARRLLGLTWPNLFAMLLPDVIQSVSSVLIGHLDKDYLAGSALGSMVFNTLGLTIGIGLSMSLETLCSQAFGAREFLLVGLQCQRVIVILTLFCVPVLIAWLFTAPLLIALGIPTRIAQLSHVWVRYLAVGMWPRVVWEALIRYLQAQQNAWPATGSVFAACVLYVPTALLLVRWGGFIGAAVAMALSNWYMLICLAGLVWWSDRSQASKGTYSKEASSSPFSSVLIRETWPPFSRQVFFGWGDVLRLGLASAGSLFVEWGSFEVNAVLAGNIGGETSVVPSSTHAILVQTASLWYCVPAGLSTAASTLLGSSLGAQLPHLALRYTQLAYGLTFSFSLLNSLVFVLLIGRRWGEVFTQDTEVISLTYQLLPLMALYGLFDQLKCVGVSILRGQGRPHITVWGNVFCCVVVGFGSSYLLAFRADWGLAGVWSGITLAWMMSTLLYGGIVLRTDWHQEMLHASARNARGLASMISTSSGVAVPQPSESTESEVGAYSEEVESIELRPLVG
jgi:MATE family multidrug resistance protein